MRMQDDLCDILIELIDLGVSYVEINKSDYDQIQTMFSRSYFNMDYIRLCDKLYFYIQPISRKLLNIPVKRKKFIVHLDVGDEGQTCCSLEELMLLADRLGKLKVMI